MPVMERSRLCLRYVDILADVASLATASHAAKSFVNVHDGLQFLLNLARHVHKFDARAGRWRAFHYAKLIPHGALKVYRARYFADNLMWIASPERSSRFVARKHPLRLRLVILS